MKPNQLNLMICNSSYFTSDTHRDALRLESSSVPHDMRKHICAIFSHKRDKLMLTTLVVNYLVGGEMFQSFHVWTAWTSFCSLIKLLIMTIDEQWEWNKSIKCQKKGQYIRINLYLFKILRRCANCNQSAIANESINETTFVTNFPISRLDNCFLLRTLLTDTCVNCNRLFSYKLSDTFVLIQWFIVKPKGQSSRIK